MTQKVVKNVRVVFHEGSLTGAPIACCRVLEALAKLNSVDVSCVFLRDGPIEKRVRTFAPTHTLLPTPTHRYDPIFLTKELTAHVWSVTRRRKQLRTDRVALCLYNSVAALRGHLMETHREARKWLWIHEMPGALSRLRLVDAFLKFKHSFEKFLAVSHAVRNGFIREFGIAEDRIEVFSGTLEPPCPSLRSHSNAVDVRKHLGLPQSSFIVGMAGSLIRIKGVERFVRLAHNINRHSSAPPVHFVWIGAPTGEISLRQFEQIRLRYGATDVVHHIPFQRDIQAWLEHLDLFFLPSLEDSFPLVVLEAGGVKVPSVCYARCGGAPELIDDERFLLNESDEEFNVARIRALLSMPELRREAGERLQQRLVRNYTAEARAAELQAMIHQALKASDV